MVVKRKKKTIDGMDRSILRSINSSRRSLSSRQIAKNVNMSSSAILVRLNNLRVRGILKSKAQGIRKFNRTFSNNKTRTIKAPRSIYWDIDIAKELKKEKRKFLRS